ncbi:MAG: polysaccharide deacetylase, partial [Ruminiclostridium sp.]
MKIKKVITIFIFLILLAIAVDFFVTRKNNSKVNSGLSDLGGVYSASSRNIDYSTELTGRLIEEDLAMEDDTSK